MTENNEKRKISRRDILAGTTAALKTATAGCMGDGDSEPDTTPQPTQTPTQTTTPKPTDTPTETPTPTQTSTPAPEFDPDLSIKFENTDTEQELSPDEKPLEAWNNYKLIINTEQKGENNPEISNQHAEITINGPEVNWSEKEQEIELEDPENEDLKPLYWGEADIKVTVQTDEEVKKDSEKTANGSFQIAPKTPESFETETFRTFLDEIEENNVDKDNFLYPLTSIEENYQNYLPEAEAVFNTLDNLIEENSMETAVELAEILENYGTGELDSQDLKYIQAIPDSNDELELLDKVFETRFRDSTVLSEYDLKKFEVDLFNFDELLENPYLDTEPWEDDERLQEFFEIRENLLEGGIEQNEIEYLQQAAEYAIWRGNPQNSKPKRAEQKGLWKEATEKGHITDQELKEFQDLTYDNKHADNYDPEIKENVLKQDPDKDTVLIHTRYTKDTDYEEVSQQFQHYKDYMNKRYGLEIIELEGNKDIEPPQDWADVWLSYNDEEDKELIEGLGAHSITFAHNTKEYGGMNWAGQEDTPHKFRIAFVDTNETEREYRYLIAQEMLEMMGAKGQPWHNNNYPETVEGEWSYVSYDFDPPHTYLDRDIELAKEDEYGLHETRKYKLEELHEENKTLKENKQGFSVKRTD